MRIKSPFIVLAASLLATAFAPGAAFARPGIVPGTGGHAPLRTQVNANTHKLLSSTIDYGSNIVTVQPYGFPVIDSTTVNCPKSTCTIVIDVAEGIGGSTTSANQWAACGVVDGNYAPNGCPYNGELLADGTFLTGTARQTFAVSHGSHTVGFEAFVGGSPAVSANFDVHYDVLAP